MAPDASDVGTCTPDAPILERVKSPIEGQGNWDSQWMAAMAVVKAGRKVFTPGNRPPGEVMPLVRPLAGLMDALRATPLDEAAAQRCAHDLVADDAAIAWACQAEDADVREFGFVLAWLATTLGP